MLAKLRPYIATIAILGLIWVCTGVLVDAFWCAGCSRSLVGTRAFVALVFLVGAAVGLFTAAWAQVRIDRDKQREDLLRRAQDATRLGGWS